MFESDNMLGKSLMRKYLLNGAGIASFPKLTLSPAGAEIVWFDSGIDYQMVYPGPRGPIPTRQSEALREGYEDCASLTCSRRKA